MTDDAIDARPAHVLWTGGWDSTFRILELLTTTERVVVPHYVVSTERASMVTELRTMKAIVDRVGRKDPDAVRRVMPFRLTLRSDIPSDPDITERWARLHAAHDLGPQYDYLCRYAKGLPDVTLEMGVIRSAGRASRLIGELLVERDGRRVLKDTAPDDVRIFAPFEFPVAHLSKPDMAREAKRLGVYDILMMSWFCHDPWRGRPCGICVPCRDAVKMGMEERLPPESRLRGRVHAVVPWTKAKGVARRMLPGRG